VNTTSSTLPTSTSSCIAEDPSPGYWFPDWAFQYAYADSDPCKYNYCRAWFNQTFHSQGDEDALRKTVTGPYLTSTEVPVTITEPHTTYISTSTIYTEVWGAKTLSGLDAWWGRKSNEPCCDVCHISAGTIDLFYWPSSAKTPATSTIVRDGYTFVSPSV
jgi:hypothetical protein